MNSRIKYLLLIIFTLSFSVTFAGEIETGNPERKRSNSEAMTEQVYKKFVKLQEMIADERYVEARAGLQALQSKGRINNFEKANISQYIGWIDSAEGKYIAAARQFQLAIDSDALPNQAHFSMMLQVAQMLLVGDKYQQGLDVLHKFYKVTDKIKDTTYAMEANAYAQLKQLRKAIPVLKKAIGLADKPNESWNYLLYSLHMQLSQFLEASKVLETLIAINPNKKEYWKRLSSVYFNLKKDQKALATLVVAEKNGMIDKEKDKMHLFKMYAFLGNPYNASKVLNQGLKDGVIQPSFKKWDELGKMWYMAAEMDNALEAYNQASKLATDGKIDFQRAYIYLDREDWPRVISALKSALEKGGLKDKKIGQAWLLLGMAHSELGSQNKAVAALKNATKYENTRNNAVQWLDHIASQRKRDKAEAEQIKILQEEPAEEQT